VLDELYVDDAVDIVEEMPATVVRRTLSPADAARIRHLPDWGFFWDTERQCERIGMEWPLKDE